ncbi:unnamed protein product [Orchesella dallaii]|uniref:Uncharacterized protein n=1 Tax=Orchesella dallaii TaxID=48710 RepID=A0ABP1RP76_9HEXA
MLWVNCVPWIYLEMRFPQKSYKSFHVHTQSTNTPILPDPYPSTSSASNTTPVPVRPTNPESVSQDVHQAILDKNRMHVNQIKNLEKTNKESKRKMSELEANLLRSNKKNRSLELQRKKAMEEANMCKKQSSIKELKCEKLARRKKELKDKMKKLKKEVTIFKSELVAEKDTNQKLSSEVRSSQKAVQQLKKTLECRTSSHKKELESQQQEFNRKVEDCSEAVDNEIRQYEDLLTKMHLLKKENLDIQEQMNKTKRENSNLMAKLETQKEKSQCKCLCAKRTEDLLKLVRQLQQSKDSEVQPTPKQKMRHTMS